eukprot:scaffold215727_cov22-Tisochrysis_lutea.AAC.2
MQVAWDESSGLVVSASYDKTIRLWDVCGRGKEVACLAGHMAPVLEMVPQGGLIASGRQRHACARACPCTPPPLYTHEYQGTH